MKTAKRQGGKIMKYAVIATVFSRDVNDQVKKIVGTFDEYYLATIMRDAYNEKFSTNSYVVNMSDLVNA